jgi:YYY domain-containing protein
MRARSVAVVAALPAILAVALALRLYGIDWDQGNLYHPDERDLLMRVDGLAWPAASDLGSLLDAEKSSWNPRWFNYGSLPIYLLKLTQLAAAPFVDLDVFGLRFPARALSAVADVLTVLMVYLLALRLGSGPLTPTLSQRERGQDGPQREAEQGEALQETGQAGRRLVGVEDQRVALLAATLTALAVLHIQLSHFYAPDTLLTLFVMLVLYCAVRVAQGGAWRWSLMAGVAVGLALGTKFSAAPVLLPLVVAHLLPAWRSWRSGPGGRWRSPVAGLALAGGAGLLVLLLVQPYGFLDWGRYWDNVQTQSEMVRRVLDYPFTRQYEGTIPYLYQIRQLTIFGLGLPLGLAAWGGLLFASAVALKRRDGALILLLLWVLPFLLITGAFPVKFIRYLLPVTPLMVLFGAQMLVAGVDWTRRRRRGLEPWAVGAVAVVVLGAAFYAASYTAVYARPHPVTRASEWLQERAPPGSTVLKEHWEEGLPALGEYRVQDLPLYNPDGPAKTASLANALAKADYLTLYSSRLYGSIPRLPERYPDTRRYYELLFGERLGYRLVHVEEAYPKLAGVAFVNDTFGRPGLQAPAALAGRRAAPVTLGLGHADDSFVVFDHPRTMVFQNVDRLSASELDLLLAGAGDQSPGFDPLLAPADEWAAQQAGGTWREIIPKDGLGARAPPLVWLVAVYLATLAALPATLLLFRWLPDRGYLLAKPLGILLVAYVSWLLASLKVVVFSPGSVLLGLLALGAVSLWVGVRRREELWGFVRQRWRLLALGEALFLVAFFAFLALRMLNPDLWHPWSGGEKPFDFAYLNAVVRSSFMPPYDPWFAGGSINYYYFGHFMVAALVRVTGVAPALAYNLAVPLFFALTVAAAFSLGYNLAEGARRGLTEEARRRVPAWSPLVAALAAVLFVAVLGNLDGGIQVAEGAWNRLVHGVPFPDFDYWRSSRMMPPDPPGHEITEFPFFTFLFADLHAHLIAIPFALLALGLALNTAAAAAGRASLRALMAPVLVLGVVVGALWTINAWDFPTYLLVALGALAGGRWLGRRTRGWRWLGPTLGLGALLLAAAVLPWLPYHLRLEGAVAGLTPSPAQTPWSSYIAIHGLFLFLVMSLVLSRGWGPGREVAGWLRARLRGTGLRPLRWGMAVLGMAFAALPVALAASGFVTVALLLLLLAPVLFLAWRSSVPGDSASTSASDFPSLPFLMLLVAATFLIGVAADLVVLDRDIERLNTVFKLYLQGWVFLALAAAFALWHLGFVAGLFRARRAGPRLWMAGLALLLLGAGVYPVLGTRARVAQRFEPLPMTLDGTAFMAGATYSDDRGLVALAPDAQAIRWLQDTVDGSPVLLEAVTPEYRWGARVSTYTGLPTVLGWRWHEVYRKCGFGPCEAADARVTDVTRIYSTTDVAEALGLLERYGVRYVYLGETERNYYPEEGLAKFTDMVREGTLRLVYERDGVLIYEVEGWRALLQG